MSQCQCAGSNTAERIVAFDGNCLFPWLSAPAHRFARGVAQPLRIFTVFRLLSVLPASLYPFCAGVSAIGVGHPEKPLPDVRCADPRSAEIGGPDRIGHSFQVSSYSGEPEAPILTRNLFAKDDWRAALVDDPSEGWPKVSFVISPFSLACRAERLARA